MNSRGIYFYAVNVIISSSTNFVYEALRNVILCVSKEIYYSSHGRSFAEFVIKFGLNNFYSVRIEIGIKLNSTSTCKF